MKTKWMIIPVIALTLGCSREIDTNVTYINGVFTLYATSGENDTRTVLQQDGRVFWSPSDCITVFYGNIPGKFTSTNTEPAASAEFTGSLGSFAIDGETEFRAIYPHSNDIVTPTDEGILSIGLPWEQTGVEGTFADDLFICVAKSKDVNLHFYNVCGGVKFSLARGDIKKVVFRGNNGETLAGRMAVQFDSKGIPQVTDMTGGKSSVTLLAPDGGTFKEGAFYYIVLVPQSLTKGYTMELYTDELVETISSEASVTVRRAAWGVLKNLGQNYMPSAIPEAIDLGLPSGLKWASFNLGATKPEEYGDYYAWGETEPYYISQNPIIWKEGKESGYDLPSYQWFNGSTESITKYCTQYYYGDNGFTDGKTVLELEDDAAHVNLGDKWRMPTIDELKELMEECTWESSSSNPGYEVTGPNGNSIFFPFNGNRFNTEYYKPGKVGGYWTSSLSVYQVSAIGLIMGSYWAETSEGTRYNGYSIRPVYGEPAPSISVISISINITELELGLGESSAIIATVFPEDATEKSVLWSSSNELIATVSSAGVVTGVAIGTAVITATTVDGGYKASCNVVVSPSSSYYFVPEIVDLGLPSGLKWASFNLGASKPEEFGDYYAWGETEPYYISLDPLVWKEGKEGGYSYSSYKWSFGSSQTLTKYCTESSCGYNGYTDGKHILDLLDDAAHVNLGGKWRIPTSEEWYELQDNGTWTWTTENGVEGYRVTSKVPGYTNHSIFLPAAGIWSDTYRTDSHNGHYGAASIDRPYPYYCWDMDFSSSHSWLAHCSRCYGFSIRPVYAE